MMAALLCFHNRFLAGDAAFDRVGVQQQPDKHRAALNSGDYVFRACPMLNYRQRHELNLAKAQLTTTTTAASGVGVGVCVWLPVLLAAQPYHESRPSRSTTLLIF